MASAQKPVEAGKGSASPRSPQTRRDLESSAYKSYITPRSTTIITRTAPVETLIQRQVTTGLHVAPGTHSNMASAGVKQTKNRQEKEKKDMQGLNQRLGSYIEKVRFLEAQNRKLAQEIENLRGKWSGDSSHIKKMYETELKTARDLIDDTEKEKAKLEVRLHALEDQINDTKKRNDELAKRNQVNEDKINRQTQQLAEIEPEMAVLRKRINTLEEERQRDKKDIKRLQEELARTKMDLDNETMAHIDAENRRQTLEEEIEFLKGVHEQELKDLAAMAYRDTTPENREYWKSELSQAIRDIQNEYETKIEYMKHEMETSYNMKINEFKSGVQRQNVDNVAVKDENKKLRININDLRNKFGDSEAKNALLEKQLSDLRRLYDDNEKEWDKEKIELLDQIEKLKDELEQISQECEILADKKLSMELEIAAYRKLLESEESRFSLQDALSDAAQGNQGGGPGGKKQPDQGKGGPRTGVTGMLAAKTTYQRSAKGPISVSETHPDGAYIALENTSKKEEALNGWQLKRLVDGKKEYNFELPPLRFAPNGQHGSVVKVWAKGHGPVAPGDIEYTGNTWGVGTNAITTLFNDKNEERAALVQKTVYHS